MQRAKNMAETLKFVYVLILFISILFVVIVCDSSYIPISHPCTTVKDCPEVKNYKSRCLKGLCISGRLR
ncbi:putative Late nodulin [Medicago truncatula]|uniref:Putative Late nodulin n=1 Tax=Medicago truncatula TaxID=3880 RepID=I3TAG3_MEDTR|nr:unknown [Medicago truncatula]RHN44143.1 putative Late nodulin [Medicago truncatula]